jgi:hypothetical protein
MGLDEVAPSLDDAAGGASLELNSDAEGTPQTPQCPKTTK